MTSPEYPEKLQDEKIRELKTMYNMKSWRRFWKMRWKNKKNVMKPQWIIEMAFRRH